MPWYLAYLLMHQEPRNISAQTCDARKDLCLIKAVDSSAAYNRSFEIGRMLIDPKSSRSAGDWAFDGLTELLMLPEEPAAGSELSWKEEELTPSQLQNRVLDKSALTAFRLQEPGEVCVAPRWYICSLVLAEVHDTGSHGERFLVWTNSYLVKADDAETAYSAAVNVGRTLESESGSHKCDGDIAHWDFKGVSDLVQTLVPPVDGGTLWSRTFSISLSQLRELVPPRSELGVFAWEEVE